MKFKLHEIGPRQITAPDYEEDYDSICTELKSVSELLRDLLPDPSIGPEERVERLARIVPGSTLQSQFHLTARTKLNRIRSRLKELTPSSGPLSSHERLKILIDRIHHQIPDPNATLFQKLETLGDHRVSDIGR